MNFHPVVPIGGIAGWNFLKRTREVQQEAFDTSIDRGRDVNYFKENIGNINTAEELVSDYRLLSFALGAFGLESDVGNKFFIQKILNDGTFDTDALANRLTDKRYLEFTKAFGFGDFDTPNTKLSDFPDKIISAYKTQQFEVAVGVQDENMRLAMGLGREMDELLDRDMSENGKWFSIMGMLPVRKVFETALGLPSSFGALDLDLQLKTFKEKAEKVFGSDEVSQFSDPEKQEHLVRLFLVQSDIRNGSAATSSGAVALALLRGG